MLLLSPQNLHYPITVTELLKQRDDNIEKLEPIFAYFYESKVLEGNRYGEEREVTKTFPTRFESETEGRLVNWKIAKGSVIDCAGVALVEIEEPCRHDVQYGGMCAACGQDMTEIDYNTIKPNFARANISLPYVTENLRLTQNAAARGEDAVKRRLLQARKLILVVDLDQTIIHASVEETIGEWQNDVDNPNHGILQDVRNFQLDDIQRQDRKLTYYVKPRPGLFEFLNRISKLYEMHIYTMGTGEYARNILKIVDSEGKLFGDRIISRDESKSIDSKNIRQMFPVDTKMVLIIDDRGDVWGWSECLVKVKPYTFFVGTGDINGMFLPKRQEALDVAAAAASPLSPVTVSPPPDPRKDQEESATIDEPQPNEEVEVPLHDHVGTSNNGTGPTGVQDQILLMNDANDAKTMEEKIAQQNEEFAAQIEDRPLLQQQKVLDKAEEEATAQAVAHQAIDNPQAADAIAEIQPHRRQLLQDDDVQLFWLEQHLQNMHQLFYEAYSRNKIVAQGGRVAELRGERSPRKRADDDMIIVPDIKEIMTPMRRRIFQDVNLTFTGVFKKPKNAHPSFVLGQDWAQWAVFCSASINLEVDKDTTHVIADPSRRTALVRQAERNPKIKIVMFQWLIDCLFQWKHLDERPYIIEYEPDKYNFESNLLEVLEDGKLSPSISPEGSTVTPGEDEDGWAINGTEKPLLNVNTDLMEEDSVDENVENNDEEDGNEEEEEEEEDDDVDGAAVTSPIETLEDVTDADWEAMEAEIADLSSDSDNAEDESASDYQSDDASTEDQPDGDIKKRKRTGSSRSSVERDEVSVSGSEPSSRLQQRKRRALERTSSLTNMTAVTAVNSLDENASVVVSRQEDGDFDADNNKHVEDDEDDLEKELEAQLDGLSNGDFDDED